MPPEDLPSRRQPLRQRKWHRRAAHEDEQRHDDVPEREALPSVGELAHHRRRKMPDPVRRDHQRVTERQHHHVQAAQQIEG